jgi:hypothetical protein
MPITLVNPLNETPPREAHAAPRLDTLAGKRIALLDISKPGGSVFLNRLQHLLTGRYGVREVVRVTKPTFTKPAPQPILDQLRSVHAVVEALAD